MFATISFQAEVSFASSKDVFFAISAKRDVDCFFTLSIAASVNSSVQAPNVFVYQLLFTLFSYSFGPVTPRITYFFLSADQFTRCAQKRDIPIKTSNPYSERYASSPV